MPSPSFTFTIPSIHDNLAIECRIFHPAPPADHLDATTTKFHAQAAIIAHPYAPQGGCYDDPIVQSLVQTLLQQECIVGTFNFRGAGTSTSHTTWTGRAEVHDYVSFAGLMTYYLHSLQSLSRPPSPSTPSSPQTPSSTAQTDNSATLVLAGYSYGALITSMLPPMPALLLPFTAPSANPPITEIRLRAEHLARERHREENVAHKRPRPASRGRASGTLKPIAIGGEESTTTPASSSSRTSRESSRKSVEGALRRSFDMSRRKLQRNRHSGGAASVDGGGGGGEGPSDAGNDDDSSVKAEPAPCCWPGTKTPIPHVKTAYLLVSPPLAPLSHLLTAFSSLFTHGHVDGVVEKARQCEGLVVYGGSDGFTSAKKYAKWAGEIEEESGGNGFKFHRVAGGGHFYREEGALEELLQAVGIWAGGVLGGGG